MSDLVKRLRIKAGMIEMGEMIAWGSDSALMREAADALELAAPVAQGEPVAEEVELLERQAAEREQLLAEPRANDQQAMGYLNQIRQLVGGDDFPDMVRRCEKLRKDAERYRWLRLHATLDGDSYYIFPEVDAWEYKEGAEPNEQYGSLDAAIDAAMELNK